MTAVLCRDINNTNAPPICLQSNYRRRRRESGQTAHTTRPVITSNSASDGPRRPPTGRTRPQKVILLPQQVMSAPQGVIPVVGRDAGPTTMTGTSDVDTAVPGMVTQRGQIDQHAKSTNRVPLTLAGTGGGGGVMQSPLRFFWNIFFVYRSNAISSIAISPIFLRPP